MKLSGGGPPTSKLRVLVLGDGHIARAAADRLLAQGYRVRCAGPSDWRAEALKPSDVLLLALTDGRQVEEVLSEPGAYGSVLDLTTVGPESAARCAVLASSRCSYSGGGITSGAAAVSNGEAVLLLGPMEPEAPSRQVAEQLGRIITFRSCQEAASAKLLHNAYLLGQQFLLATVLATAAEHGVGSAMTDVLCAGTAGRPACDSSLLRVMRGGHASSYRAGLAAKDLMLTQTSFGRLDSDTGIIGLSLEAFQSSDPNEPFTAPLTRRISKGHESYIR